ncbi:MAG: NADH-quinone oxidoreductase subunit A [Dehalococcoidia bacterium]|nr:NADH-quinone oxidoreductase subunit A [Chloroflexota bacterium]MBE32283.1 NADH-quinone oxidoreductase subunit A [Rickettsiales bacterium]MBN33019.1 NADH-quinone oxidoreductase subunit A [Dehalococcoidia bacterium]
MIVLSKLAQFIKVRPSNPSKLKESMYECGMKPETERWQGFNIKYYFYALLFVIFDVETIFLFPWAAKYGIWSKEFGLMFFLSMFVFLAVVTLGYVYAWKKGDLEWN